MPKTNNLAIDKSIGDRVKLHRKQANISQSALGKHLGVTFQQVQKYENGTNKLSAATLFKIANFLNISVVELMVDDQKSKRISTKDMIRFAKSPEGKSLLQGFMAIDDLSIRRRVLGLVEAAGP